MRLELLGIIFKSVGLPEMLSRASFVMWLRSEGIEEDVGVARTGSELADAGCVGVVWSRRGWGRAGAECASGL